MNDVETGRRKNFFLQKRVFFGIFFGVVLVLWLNLFCLRAAWAQTPAISPGQAVPFSEPLTTQFPESSVVVPAEKSIRFLVPGVDKVPNITGLALMKNGTVLITGGDDNNIRVWNVEQGTLLAEFNADVDWIRNVAVHPNDDLFATIGQNGTVHFWSLKEILVDGGKSVDMNKALVRTIDKKIQGAEDAIFSPDGLYYAVCGFNEFVNIFEVKSGKLLHSWNVQDKNMRTLAFSSDSRKLAVAGRSGVIRIREMESGNIVSFKADDRRINAVAFAPGDQFLVSVGDGESVKYWNLQKRTPVIVFDKKPGKSFSVCFCSEDLFVTGESNNVLRFWSISQKKEVGHGLEHTGTISAIQYHPASKLLLTGSFDTTVRYWNLDELDKK